MSHGSVFIKTQGAAPSLVQAHLDTGASVTSIDIKLAHHMRLTPVGTSQMMTAGGMVRTPSFIIDLQFPASTLSSRTNLSISSCDMGFDVNSPLSDIQNFGILIGRDVMALWNIVWNGPTSTVIIND
ncbi:MAG: retropepsin-like domain-containing protein [Chitinispirillales bacterium]|nr:retropepsin-like domain-containing protein [Chitinispirillales bacterium]